jgi:hypothetical protein
MGEVLPWRWQLDFHRNSQRKSRRDTGQVVFVLAVCRSSRFMSINKYLKSEHLCTVS